MEDFICLVGEAEEDFIREIACHIADVDIDLDVIQYDFVELVSNKVVGDEIITMMFLKEMRINGVNVSKCLILDMLENFSALKARLAEPREQTVPDACLKPTHVFLADVAVDWKWSVSKVVQMLHGKLLDNATTVVDLGPCKTDVVAQPELDQRPDWVKLNSPPTAPSSTGNNVRSGRGKIMRTVRSTRGR